MEINKIYNEDCFDTMRKMVLDNQKVDCILTSPPYCTVDDPASLYSEKRFNNHKAHYDVFEGFNGPDDYRQWSLELFTLYNSVLVENGVVLYNISYTVEYPNLMWLVISDIITNTSFMVADCISWKKKSALPANQNPNKLTRICELILVFVRNIEYSTFRCNKELSGNNKYKNLFFNFVEASNNDILNLKVNRLNGACFSSDLVNQLLNIYCKPGDLVYDSFMGTGTTAVACKQFGCNFIGSELSKAQVEFAQDRLYGIGLFKKTHTKKLF